MTDKEIVVAYDGSEQAGAAVDWAAREALARQVRLRVVYVERPNVLAGPPGGDPWMAQQIEEIGRQLTDEAEERARRVEGVDVQSTVLTGPPAGALVDTARDAELLVLGTRGRGEFASALLGSVAYSVSAHAACPVVVVRGDGQVRPGPSAPVVVGVDGSEPSREAVDTAADAAHRYGAPLTVVAAWQGAYAGAWAGEYWAAVSAEALADMDKAAQRETQDVVDSAVAQAKQRHGDVEIRGVTADGMPAKVLVDASADAGLLVVGARGRGGFTGLLLGSVSHGVIHAASRPVMVVRAVG
ncbi:MAG TPA: universal stress protein [Actinomycetales bacterium]|nr:universal stress protein [Actinomycetales bacterium]